jgi:hypothetical protein
MRQSMVTSFTFVTLAFIKPPPEFCCHVELSALLTESPGLAQLLRFIVYPAMCHTGLFVGYLTISGGHPLLSEILQMRLFEYAVVL